MTVLQSTQKNWETLAHKIGKGFEKRASKYDKEGSFVFENYKQLKTHRFFSAMIPLELGGGGMSYPDMCNIIKTIAHYCASTALAFSMHQHLIAASVWKYKHKGLGKEMLEKVAKNQLVLISTGARDWLGSNGEMKKVNGGYLLTAKKHFASQSIAGDIAITSAPYQEENGEWKVLHFPVPMKAEGVSVLDDWKVMGMRATGSQTIVFDQVFISEKSIALARPRDEFHMVWNVVLTVAMPLIMSAYVGIAEKAMKVAIRIGKNYQRNQGHIKYLIGKLNNVLLSAQVQRKAMIHLTNDFNFQPSQDITIDMLSYKTNVADACKQTVADAMEAIGGQSFYEKNILERLFRDVQASEFHPLPKWDQYAFTGERILETVDR